jgi:hypothetical protein
MECDAMLGVRAEPLLISKDIITNFQCFVKSFFAKSAFLHNRAIKDVEKMTKRRCKSRQQIAFFEKS